MASASLHRGAAFLETGDMRWAQAENDKSDGMGGGIALRSGTETRTTPGRPGSAGAIRPKPSSVFVPVACMPRDSGIARNGDFVSLRPAMHTFPVITLAFRRAALSFGPCRRCPPRPFPEARSALLTKSGAVLLTMGDLRNYVLALPRAGRALQSLALPR
jgi:hypothetical protein